MSSEYPRIGREDAIRPKGICVVCGLPKSERKIHVEINIFRGDDDTFKAHKLCMKEARKLVLAKYDTQV